MSMSLQKNANKQKDVKTNSNNYIKIEENKINESPPQTKITKPLIKSKKNQQKVNKQQPMNNIQTDLIINSLEEKYKSYDSKMLSEPIINSSNFQKALDSQIKHTNKEKMKLKLLQYSILKESIDQCSSFPSKTRKYIWQYLFSLPNNISLYQSYLSRGIHPFYKFIDEMYPLHSEAEAKNLKIVCSLLAHWSSQVGNIYFLPNIVFPFIKSFPNQNHFVFETLIAFFTSISNYWFEYYPGAPLYHIKLSEQILRKEIPEVHEKLQQIYKEAGITQLKITEIIWRLIKHLFSESLIKEHWLQLMDFLICYNHKPEMVLYLAVAFLNKLKNLILKVKNGKELRDVLFEINADMSLSKVFKNTLMLYKKYNRYQLFKYKPYIPMEFTFYPKVVKNFPLDCVRNSESLEKEMYDIDKEYDRKDESLNKLEANFKKLLTIEEKMQRHFESEVNKENQKDEIIRHELDIALYHKMKYTDELTNRKIDKLSNLNSIIKKSVNVIDELNNAQIIRTQQEMQLKKEYEGNVLQQKLIYNTLHKCDKEANRCLNKLVDLRQKKQNEMEFNDKRDYEQKANENIEDGNYFDYKYDIYDNNNKMDDIKDIKRKYDHISKMDNEFLEKDAQMENETMRLMEKLNYGGVIGKGLKFENAVLAKYADQEKNVNRSINGDI